MVKAVNNKKEFILMFYFEGSRNNRLYQIACAMFGRGESLESVRKEIQKENTWCKPPLDAKEIGSIVKSASKHEPNPVYPREDCIELREAYAAKLRRENP